MQYEILQYKCLGNSHTWCGEIYFGHSLYWASRDCRETKGCSAYWCCDVISGACEAGLLTKNNAWIEMPPKLARRLDVSGVEAVRDIVEEYNLQTLASLKIKGIHT